MSGPKTNPYLRTRIMTAGPHELRLMLYDGAIKFCRQACAALEKQDYEASYEHLMRAQKIVLELSTSLNHKVDEELTSRLSALYTFIYRKLVDANMNRQIEHVREALELLEYERETWQMLMNKLADDPSDDAAESPPLTGAQQTTISTWSQSA